MQAHSGLAIWQIELGLQKIYNFSDKNMSSKENSLINGEPEIIEQRNSKNNNCVVRRYAKKRFLGKGGFAHCYEVQNVQSKKISAIKIVSKQTLKKNKAKQKLVTEIKIHKSLEHKNILLFDHVFEDSQNVYIVLQLCSNHTLNEMMKKRKRITESELQYYLYHLIQGLIYIHHQKVIHRDLKLGNIMLNDNMEIKIGDFGLAAKLDYEGERRKTICGTPNYLAPEIISNLGHSYEADIWSLGVVMYTLLYGRPPFETSDVKKTYKRIKECQYTFNEDIPVSQTAKALISKILMVEAAKRLTLEQILTHPFMTSTKIPKQMPLSVLTQAPTKVFPQHTGFLAHSSTKTVPVKTEPRGEADLQIVKSQKGTSERLLLRTATGFNRNLFYNKQTSKEEMYQLKSNVHLLNNYFNKPESAKTNYRQNLSGANSVYVKKWVDYSSKYGLGYLLSDSTTGIYFNDSTKMVIDQTGQKVDYISNEGQNSRKLSTFTVHSCPDEKEVSKKLTLMQYFRKYLQSGCSESAKEKKDGPPFVYVKKWVKHQQGILFRLNNKVIQVNFNDKSQIIIYTDKDLLLYSNSQGKDKQVLDLNSGDLAKNAQITLRLEQAKLMLRKLKTDPAEDRQREQPLRIEAVQS